MGNLRIVISDELHKDLKQKALEEGVSLRRLVVQTLAQSVEQRKVSAPQQGGN